MHELLLLTKSGREITVGAAANDDEARQLGEAAQQLLAGLKQATERGDVIAIDANGTMYWILPTEIEGMSLYQVDEEADGAGPGVAQLGGQGGGVRV